MSEAHLQGRTVAVWCASRDGAGKSYRAIATAAGAEIARRGGTIVYGGGGAGMMGAVADAALRAGGRVHGVIPAAMVERELAHQGLTELEIVEDMMVRKRRMLEVAGAFLVLPGGIGTLDELFEALTWNQLGLHAAARVKPVVVLDADGFYADLLSWFERATEAGLVSGTLARPAVAVTLDAAIAALA